MGDVIMVTDERLSSWERNEKAIKGQLDRLFNWARDNSNDLKGFKDQTTTDLHKLDLKLTEFKADIKAKINFQSKLIISILGTFLAANIGLLYKLFTS